MIDTNAVIVFDDVSFAYGAGTPLARTALDHVTLSLREGVITGIVGHTGCGKSTLVQQMNGLLRPDSGTVYFRGKNIWDEPKKIRELHFKVGLVFQYPEYQLFEETAGKDIAYGPKNMGLSDEEIDERVRRAAAFVGLDASILEQSPFELSGGQKRRVAIAGVLAMDPDVLILDEPAAGLDPIGREDIFGGLRAYQRQSGKTVVIVSHSMEDMARYADRIIVMNKGTVIREGVCKEVFNETELLRSVGLNIPQITILMQKLKEAGMPISDDIFTVEDAKRELLPHLKGVG